MINTPAILRLNDQEIVPVRAIPFVTGGDMGPRCLASILSDPEQNFLAYVLGPNNVATPMLPKHWRQYVAQLSANGTGAPDLYTRTELEILPVSTFVYWDGLWRTHESHFLPSRELIAGLSDLEQRNYELEPNARIPEELVELVFKDFGSLVHTGQPALDAATGAATEPPETAVQRQDRRLKQCVDAGLNMNINAVGRLPNGIGEVAEAEGVKRQSFSEDVKAAIARRDANKTLEIRVHRA